MSIKEQQHIYHGFLMVHENSLLPTATLNFRDLQQIYAMILIFGMLVGDFKESFVQNVETWQS